MKYYTPLLLMLILPSTVSADGGKVYVGFMIHLEDDWRDDVNEISFRRHAQQLRYAAELFEKSSNKPADAVTLGQLHNTRPPAADPHRPAELAQRSTRPRGILTYIPSDVAGEKGIAVRVVAPEKPRYETGAPVVIGVNPGPHDAAGRLGAAECGFVEVFFASTDFGKGPYDFGGPNWIRGLRDVILFAVGRTADKEGRTIGDLTGEIPVLTANVGTIGLSHGGNACGAVMGLYGQDFPKLAYYVSWESPYGEGAVGEELGSPRRASGRVNPAYDAQTSRLDLSKLAYDPDLAMTGRGRTQQQRRELPFRGSLFFDMDGDGRYDPQIDFRHQPARFDPRQDPKFWYSIRLLREAERRNLFGDSWPAHIATVEEAREFWHCRDATGLVPDAIRKIPNLAVIIVANEHDHMQVAPDHPHIQIQANAFQEAGARFVRVNPDRAYVEWLIGESRPGLVDNDGGMLYTPNTIHAALCPNEAAHRILQVAAMCELADRVQAGNFEPNLDKVLFPDASRVVRPPMRDGQGPGRDGLRPPPGGRQFPPGRVLPPGGPGPRDRPPWHESRPPGTRQESNLLKTVKQT